MAKRFLLSKRRSKITIENKKTGVKYKTEEEWKALKGIDPKKTFRRDVHVVDPAEA